MDAQNPKSAAIVVRQGDVPSRSTLLRSIVDDFFAGLSDCTRRGYRQDLTRFASFIGLDTTDPDQGMRDAAQRLFSLQAHEANYLAREFRISMGDAAPATINRRLSALRSLTKLGRRLGLITWALEVDGPKPELRRDVRGPTQEEISKLFTAAHTQAKFGTRGLSSVSCFAGIRMVALLSLLYTRGLRSIEVRELRIEHLKLNDEPPVILVRGKGHSELSRLTIADETRDSLKHWVAVAQPTAFVFTRRDWPTTQMSGPAFWKLVAEFGAAVGLHLWPHGLRHRAITEALEVTNGNVAEVQKFSRHSKPETVIKYNDDRKDAAGKITELLARKKR